MKGEFEMQELSDFEIPCSGRASRLSLFLILFLAFTNLAIAQRPTVSVQGTVIRDGSGDPLSKARVELRGGNLPEPITTTTETDGRFYFPNLPPGAYEISVRRDGFAPAEVGQKWPGGPGVPVQLRAGQPAPDVVVRMVAAAAISGRVADSSGQPLPNAQVQALKSTFQGELRILVPVQQVRTNATGEFRLYGLPAGRYFVNVIVPGYSANAQLLVNNGGRTDQNAPYQMSNQPRNILGQTAITASNPASAQVQDVGPIYFPSTPYIQTAAPIDLRPGMEYRGADTQMAPIRRFTVCGVVRGIPPPQSRVRNNPGGPIPPPPPPPRQIPGGQAASAVPNVPNPNDPCGIGTTVVQDPVGSVQMVPLDVELRSALNAQGNRYNGVVDGTTGQFVIRNVLPGLYNLATFISNMDAATTVDVRNRDVENVSLTLVPGFPLPTRITMEGAAPGAALPGGLTMLIGSSPPTQGTSPNQPVDPSGSFSIPNVGTDDTRVYVLPMLTTPVGPPLNIPDSLQGVYVKSAKLGGVDVLNTGFRFAGEPDKVLEIVLAKNAGSLTGRVEDERKQPASGVFVVLVPNLTGARLYRTDMYKVTNTDEEGRFEVKGLPPGDYKVFALAGFEKDAWIDPDFFKPYEERGMSVPVGEGKVFALENPLSVVRQQ
jgi:protocatechuate 3,4-dioxygenase beta subunit